MEIKLPLPSLNLETPHHATLALPSLPNSFPQYHTQLLIVSCCNPYGEGALFSSILVFLPGRPGLDLRG